MLCLCFDEEDPEESIFAGEHGEEVAVDVAAAPGPTQQVGGGDDEQAPVVLIKNA